MGFLAILCGLLLILICRRIKIFAVDDKVLDNAEDKEELARRQRLISEEFQQQNLKLVQQRIKGLVCPIDVEELDGTEDMGELLVKQGLNYDRF